MGNKNSKKKEDNDSKDNDNKSDKKDNSKLNKSKNSKNDNSIINNSLSKKNDKSKINESIKKDGSKLSISINHKNDKSKINESINKNDNSKSKINWSINNNNNNIKINDNNNLNINNKIKNNNIETFNPYENSLLDNSLSENNEKSKIIENEKNINVGINYSEYFDYNIEKSYVEAKNSLILNELSNNYNDKNKSLISKNNDYEDLKSRKNEIIKNLSNKESLLLDKNEISKINTFGENNEFSKSINSYKVSDKNKYFVSKEKIDFVEDNIKPKISLDEKYNYILKKYPGFNILNKLGTGSLGRVFELVNKENNQIIKIYE